MHGWGILSLLFCFRLVLWDGGYLGRGLLGLGCLRILGVRLIRCCCCRGIGIVGREILHYLTALEAYCQNLILANPKITQPKRRPNPPTLNHTLILLLILLKPKNLSKSQLNPSSMCYNKKIQYLSIHHHQSIIYSWYWEVWLLFRGLLFKLAGRYRLWGCCLCCGLGLLVGRPFLFY